MSRRFLCCLLLASASAIYAQEKETPSELADPTDAAADGRVHLMLDPGGHAAMPRHLAFTPDGTKLVSCGDDHTIQVWDVGSRERLRVIRPPTGVNHAGGASEKTPGLKLVMDRQSKQVAFCTEAKDDKGEVVRTTFVCSLETGEAQVLKRSGPRDFAPDGKFLAIGEGREVRLVEIANDAPKLTTTILPAKAKNSVLDLAYSPDGNTLAVVAGDSKIYLLDADKLQLKQTWTVPGVNNFRHVSWADDQTILCHTWSSGKALVVVNVQTGELRTSYSLGELFKQLPKGREKTEAFIAMQAAPGTTKVLIRLTNSLPGGRWANTNYLLNWASGEAGQVCVLDTEYGCNATAVAPDLSVAAQGDGALNDIILWDPKEGEPFKDGNVVRRLRAAVRGVDGRLLNGIRWRPDGKGVVWVGIHDGKDNHPVEMDLSTLALRRLSWDQSTKYNRQNADLAHGDKIPSKGETNESIYERGLVRQWGPLSLTWKYPVLTIVGGPQPVTFKPDNNVGWDHTFAADGRVVTHPHGKNYLQVFDSATGKRLYNTKVSQSHVLTLAVSPKPECRYVLVGSADQTVTVYNPATNKVLLTIFPAGADWIAWTPEGYYAATPGGERLMGWQVENGPDKLASFYPADRFHKTLFRPDVIKLLLEKGGVEEALKAANAALAKDQRPATDAVADVAKMAPPRATLKLVARNDKGVVQLTTDAAADAGGEGVKSLRVLVDGRSVSGDEYAKKFDTPQAKVSQTWSDLELPPGKHRVVVQVKSEDASSQSNALEIDTRPLTELPVMYVLAVGVSQYQDKGLNLNCADADASLIANTLKSACKGELFSDVLPTVLLNDKATRAAVLGAFKNLRKQVKQNDKLVIFFAGHGTKDNQQFYLLTHEANVNKLEGSALSGRELREELKEVPCQVLLIMDACHSAGFGATGELSRQNLKPATDDATRTFTDDEVGVPVMCAAMGTEEASENGEHGLFTQELVKALTDAHATFNHANGKQYLHHLQADVFDGVVDESKDKQHPFLHLPWTMQSFPMREVNTKK